MNEQHPETNSANASVLLDGITRALTARDMPGAVALLKALAVVDPGTAAAIYDTVHMLAYLDKAARQLGAPT